MNNVIIGGADWTYYETIGGGQGANPDGPGPSGVHVGMSNTLNTPVEALELEYPMRVESYELVDGSGGAGAIAAATGSSARSACWSRPRSPCSPIAGATRPQGAEGGEPGRPGENRVNGDVVAPKLSRALAAGDVVCLRTPGGGGYGEPP